MFLQNNFSHSTLKRVKCEKQILPSVGFENPRPPTFAARVLPLDHEGFTVKNQHRG